MTAHSVMLVPPSWPAWGEAAVLYGGVLLVWALALYVTSRGEPRRVPVLAALAMTSLSVYLFGQALGGLSPDLVVWAGLSSCPIQPMPRRRLQRARPELSRTPGGSCGKRQ